MKKKWSTIVAAMGLAVSMVFPSCEPMDADYWMYNSNITLNWAVANPETGRRPTEVTELHMRYFSQLDDADRVIVKVIRGSSQGYEIPSGIYDIMAIQPNDYLTRTDDFKTITFELPTHLNNKAETVISDIPTEMYYVGKVTGETLDIDAPLDTEVMMERILKKLNFVVVVEEETELIRPAIVDMSGMAFRKKLWNMEIGALDEAVQVFNLTKHGRYLNNTTCLTAFRGSTYCLGTCGRNILYLTLYDADNQEIVLKYDITPYLKDWSTAEETVHISVNLVGDNMQFTIDGWDTGNTSDIVFDYQVNGEV